MPPRRGIVSLTELAAVVVPWAHTPPASSPSTTRFRPKTPARRVSASLATVSAYLEASDSDGSKDRDDGGSPQQRSHQIIARGVAE